jgi:hypothetical protein
VEGLKVVVGLGPLADQPAPQLAECALARSRDRSTFGEKWERPLDRPRCLTPHSATQLPEGVEGGRLQPAYWYPQGLKSGIIRGVAGACSAGGCHSSGAAGVASASPEAGRLGLESSRRGDSAFAPPVAP